MLSTTTAALDRPDLYVMKPQREGGGNNLWDEEMITMLRELANDERRSSYILMKKLQPPHVKNRFIRRGVLSDVKTTISEVRTLTVIRYFTISYIYSFSYTSHQVRNT